MHHQRLGSTGIKISRLGLGCGNFGGIGSAPAFFGMGEDEAQAIALLDRAWDAGITLLDTADAYGGGRSEQYIGRWLAARGSSVRDRLVVSSKVYNPVGPGPNQRGLSRRTLYMVDELTSRKDSTDIPEVLDHLDVPFDLQTEAKREALKKQGRIKEMPKRPLDVLLATEGRLSEAAAALGTSTGNLGDFLRGDDKVFEQANLLRLRFGHKPLR